MKTAADIKDSSLEPPKKKAFVATIVYSSQEAESMDVDTSLAYIDHIKNSYEKENYPVSYLLTDIGNRLLLTTVKKFNDIGDPLIFFAKKLEKDKSLYETAKLGIELKTLTNEDLSAINNLLKNQDLPEEQRLALGKITQITQKYSELLSELEKDNQLSNAEIDSKINDINSDLNYINLLYTNREELNAKLINAFSFAQRHLSKTFIDKWQATFDNHETEQEINTKLQNLLEKIGYDRLNFSVNEFRSSVIKILNSKDDKTKAQDRYIAKTADSLKEKIEKVIGRKPTENEIAKYSNSHPEMKDKNVEEITAEVRDYIATNSGKILETMQEVSRYMLHPDYLEMLRETDDFLFQTFTYRHMSRDLQKVVLVEGNAEQRNIPPGINSTIKITAGGSATVFLGELGS